MKLFKNKRGYEMWMVVTAISSLALLVVLLMVYSGVFGGESDSVCKLSALANAKARIPGMGETYKLECEMDTLTITMKDLEKGSNQAERKIKDFNKKFDQEYTLYPENKRDQKEWVMDKIIADELRRWWVNMGSGQLDGLFSNWWAPLGCKSETDGDCDGIKKLKAWNWELRGPPKFCVIGTRIKFDEDIKKEFSGKINSLTEWTKKNQIPYSEESYYEYLMDESIKGQGLFERNYEYATNESYAVVFVKINEHMLETFGDSFWGQLKDHPFLTGISAAFALKKKLMLSAVIFMMGGGASTTMEATSVKSDFDAILLRPYSELNETCTAIAN